MKRWIVYISSSLLAGVAVGVLLMIPAAAVGAVKGGAALALRWSSNTGVVAGAVGLIFAGLRFFSADRDGGHYWKPGRTPLELESEVLNEHKNSAAAHGRTGTPKGRFSSLAVAVGMVLASLIPEWISMYL